MGEKAAPERRQAGPMGLLLAFLWFRRRLLVNQFRLASKGDTASQLARILAFLQPFFMAALFLPSMITIAVGGFWLGRWWGLQPDPPFRHLPLLGIVLLFVLLAGIAYSLLSVSRIGVTPARMQLLPISRRLLHGLEFASQLVNPVASICGVGLLAGSFGILTAGRLLLGTSILLASVLFLVVLVGLQFGAGLAAQWLFRDRRRGQYVSLFLLSLLAGVGFIPALLDDFDAGTAKLLLSFESVDLLLPSSQLSEVLAWGLIEDWPQVLLSLAILAGEAVILYLLTWWLYRFLQTSDGGRNSGGRRLPVAPRVLPGLDAAVAAVAQIQIRQGLRSGRGRLALLFSPLILPLLGRVLFSNDETSRFLSRLPLEPGALLALAAVAFGLLTFQPIACNLLGSDENGLARLLLLPVDSAKLVRGKALGSSALVGMAIGLGLVGSLLVEPAGSPLNWLAVLVLGAAGIAVLCPLGLVLSILLPKRADLDSWGEKGNPHPLAGLLGTLAVLPVMGIPGLLLIWVSSLPSRLPWILTGLLIWGTAGTLTSRALFRWSVRLLGRRREFLYLIGSS